MDPSLVILQCIAVDVCMYVCLRQATVTNAHDVPVLSTGDKNFEVMAELTENGVKSDSDKFLTVTVDDEDMLSIGIEAGGSISFRMTGGVIGATSIVMKLEFYSHLPYCSFSETSS